MCLIDCSFVVHSFSLFLSFCLVFLLRIFFATGTKKENKSRICPDRDPVGCFLSGEVFQNELEVGLLKVQFTVVSVESLSRLPVGYRRKIDVESSG